MELSPVDLKELRALAAPHTGQEARNDSMPDTTLH